MRDTFQEIERQHLAEKQQLQQEINKLKGIDTEHINENKLFGAVRLENNPLSGQQQQNNNLNTKPSVSPRHSSPNNSDTQKLQQSQTTQMQYSHSNGYQTTNNHYSNGYGNNNNHANSCVYAYEL